MSKSLSLYSGNNLSDIQRYLSEVSKIKLLSEEEERTYAFDFFYNKTQSSAQALIVSHLPLVVKTAYSYKGYGLSIADLISEGNIGLMKAVSKFDPTKGFRLSTYAMWWIKAYMTDYILNYWSLVKHGTTSGRKKLFFSLKKIKDRLEIVDNNISDQQIKQISKELGASEMDVISVNHMISSRDASIDDNMYNDSNNSFSLKDTLVAYEDNPEENISKKQENDKYKILVQQSLELLSDREQHILKERYLSDNPKSLADLSAEMNISRERVRQIEVSAFKKVKNSLLEESLF